MGLAGTGENDMTELMTNDVSWLMTDDTISVHIDGKTHMVARTDANGEKLIDALRNKRWNEVPDLVSIAAMIERYTEGTFKVLDGEVLVDGEVVNGLLATKIKEFQAASLPYEPLVKFARNVRKNPLKDAADRLFAFLDANKHPITIEGNFIGYKTVQTDMRDWHSGTVKYELGVAVDMPRAEVQHDPKVACGKGLHIANWHYASTFMHNGVMLKCEIAPQDVISIPLDCSEEKVRCCRIKPIEIIERPSDKLLEGCDEEDISDDADDICVDCDAPVAVCQC